jgi:hypothetical protein
MDPGQADNRAQIDNSQISAFCPEQLAALSAPLDRANARQREQGRK